MTVHESDVVVLGGGSGGYACAFRAAQLGLSVTLIEADKVGGTCLHRGCIPTKAMLHSAEVVDSARVAAEFGVDVRVSGIDMPAVQNYKNRVVDRLYVGLEGLVESHKIEFICGTGQFIGDKTIEVNGHRYRGQSVVLATGSYARTIPGFDLGPRVVTSDAALELGRIPSRVVVLGGGVIGVEFASLWSSFGSEVTIVEALDRLLPAEDAWVSKRVARAFRKRNITALTATRVRSVIESNESVGLELEGGQTLKADLVLIAVGRGPSTAGNGFERNGIVLDHGFVVTDERLRTQVDGVYAVGDIVAGLQLAHRGFQQGIFVAEQIAGQEPPVINEEFVPRVTYSRPEVASVGLTEPAAVERHGAVTAAVYDLAGNGKSHILQTSGGIKVIRAGDKDKEGPIVGVHMVGDRVGELIGEAQMAVAWEALPSDVSPFIHAHPTQNEAFGEAVLALAGKPLHGHG